MTVVGIPAYNHPELLRESLNSLKMQTYKKFFVIVVDDCSEEKLENICNEFKKDLHIVYLRQDKNMGPGCARQRIIEWCDKHKIEYVTFLDSDDMLMPHALSVLMWEANHNLADVICTPITIEADGTHHLIELSNCNTWTHGKLYRVSYLVKNASGKASYANFK